MCCNEFCVLCKGGGGENKIVAFCPQCVVIETKPFLDHKKIFLSAD